MMQWKELRAEQNDGYNHLFKIFARIRNSVRFFADCAAKKGPLPGQLEKRA